MPWKSAALNLNAGTAAVIDIAYASTCPEGYAVARGTLQAKLDTDLSLYQSQLELLTYSQLW